MKKEYVFIFIVALLLGFFFYRVLIPCNKELKEKIKTDTIVVRDTIKVPIPMAINKGVVKVETVKPKIKPLDNTKDEKGIELPIDIKNERNDTPTLTEEGNIEIPIERKEYVTEDYKAVIEGWRPSLISMEVYPKNTTITNTVTKVKKPHFSITVGPGVGYDGKSANGYIGITAGFILWSK